MTAVAARITDRKNWAPGLMTLRLDTVLAGYSPGQFVNIGLEQEGQRSRRSYSVASAVDSALEVYVAEVSGGELTPRLFRCEVGDTVYVEPRPLGFFTLERVPVTKTLWLLATGTGLGPYIAFLRSATIWTQCERVVLVHGVREANQLGYEDELRKLAQARPGQFDYVPVLSRGEQPESSAGDRLRGRITDALRTGSLEKLVGQKLVPEGNHVLLCGNPAMIDETQLILAERGLAKHRVRKPGQITFESYW